MWILTCDSGLLDGPLWLRPGTSHRLGRTSASQRLKAINHKTISRQHLVIDVGEVKSGDSGKVFERSAVTLTDNSKAGTTIEGISITKESTTLKKPQNKIQLGSSEHIFHINWVPLVLTFAKTSRASADENAKIREALDGTDVKLLNSFVSNETTHVIAKKRNYPDCLQALGQARWLVTYEWANALVEAMKPRNRDNTANRMLCLLEEDLKEHWPSEKNFIVPSNQDATSRPIELMYPNAERANLFQGLVFVFMSPSQKTNLGPVINSCGGKATIVEPIANNTTPADYMKSLGGESSNKSGADLDDIVIVRPGELTSDKEWWIRFTADVQLSMRTRSIEQGELLDVILTLDRRPLRQPLREESVREETPDLQQNGPQNTAANGTGRRLRRMLAQPRFDGFDTFDPSQMFKAESTQPSNAQLPAEDTAHEERANGQTQGISTAKRKAPVLDMSAVLDEQLQGMAAMKKRRLEDEQEHRQTANNDQAEPRLVTPAAHKEAPKVDVKSRIKARPQNEAEQHRRMDEEALQQQLGGMDISGVKAQVVTFDVKKPDRRPAAQTIATMSANWDPSWNGRPNFKGFRRRGQPATTQTTTKVMIKLVEAPRKSSAPGDVAWQSNPATETQDNSAHRTVISRSDRDSTGTQALGHLNSNGTILAEDSMRQNSTARSQLVPSKRQADDAATSLAKRRNMRAVADGDDDDPLAFRRRR